MWEKVRALARMMACWGRVLNSEVNRAGEDLKRDPLLLRHHFRLLTCGEVSKSPRRVDLNATGPSQKEKKQEKLDEESQETLEGTYVVCQSSSRCCGRWYRYRSERNRVVVEVS